MTSASDRLKELLSEEFRISVEGLPHDERAEAYAREIGNNEELQEVAALMVAEQARKLCRERKIREDLLFPADVEGLLMACADRSSELPMTKAVVRHLGAAFLEDCFDFGRLWKASGYAKMSCGHKLAAALMMTNVPSDMEVESPWKAWSLYVPNGLLITTISSAGLERVKDWVERAEAVYQAAELSQRAELTVEDPVGLAAARPGEEAMSSESTRIWCQGSEPMFVLEKMPRGLFASSQSVIKMKSPRLLTLVRNYVKGVCLSLDPTNLHRYRKPSSGGSKKSERHRRSGVEPPAEALYELGSPVTIDLRETVKKYLNEGPSRGHSAPSVQFLVRGHWRNQACGPGRVDHKHIWIEPFWKGDEQARVLLRTHSIKKD